MLSADAIDRSGLSVEQEIFLVALLLPKIHLESRLCKVSFDGPDIEDENTARNDILRGVDCDTQGPG